MRFCSIVVVGILRGVVSLLSYLSFAVSVSKQEEDHELLLRGVSCRFFVARVLLLSLIFYFLRVKPLMFNILLI